MSKRIRRTPFTVRVEKYGVSEFTVVNHTLLPKSFQKTVEEDYWHLRRNVQIWDVGCQRQVEIKGPDAKKLIQWMTPRNLNNTRIGQCLYVPLVDSNGGLLNDPVLLKISENSFWLSIADSDILLWTKGLATGANMDVQIKEPDVWPLAIQGPKAEALMTDIFGQKIKTLKFFNFDWFKFEGTMQLIARSGYSKQGGFEIYLNGANLGPKLWDLIWNAGQKYHIRPGCPNIIERIEGGLLSYGNEMTVENSPFECGLGNYVSFDDGINYLGKDILKKEAEVGSQRQIRGIKFGGTALKACSIPWQVRSKESNTFVGEITSGIYSPRLKTNIGLSMIQCGHWDIGREVIVRSDNNEFHNGVISSLPFN